MARGSWVQDITREKIARIDVEAMREGKRLTASQVLTVLQQELQKEGKEQFGEIVLRTVQDIRKEQRDRAANHHHLDQRWSLGSLVDHPIPPDTLPKVFQIHETFAVAGMGGLSIRWALWISRLSYLVPDILELPATAIIYATNEAIHERLAPKKKEMIIKATRRLFAPGVDSRLDSLSKGERESIRNKILSELLAEAEQQVFDTSEEDRKLMDDRRDIRDENLRKPAERISQEDEMGYSQEGASHE